MQLPTQVQKYNTTPVICVCMHIVMHHIYQHLVREAEPVIFFLSDHPGNTSPKKAKLNGAIHINSKIVKNVMGSAAEAEIGAGYVNSQDCVLIRITQEEMGHNQPPTPIQVDNNTSASFANGTMKQKRSKSIDMIFTGCKTGQHRASLNYIEGREKAIMGITTANIILQLITREKDQYISKQNKQQII